MTKDEFYNQLAEFLDQFDYESKEFDVSDEIMSLGASSLQEIIEVFNACFACEERLPQSPFTVSAGQVEFGFGLINETLTLELDVN